MPLVIITGIPSSGKSTTASKLSDHLKSKGKTSVHIVSENGLLVEVDKNVALSDSKIEKSTRADLKSQVLRLLTKEAVVIVDGLNYIKGYRYELYCASKSVKTTQVTIHCDLSPEDAWQWNLQRPDHQKWNRDTFDALIMRYEAPNGANRWDSPLFLALKAVPLDCDQVEAALYDRKPPPPNQSTQCQPLSSANFLHQLDRVTGQIVQDVIKAMRQGTFCEGDAIKVTGSDEKVVADRKVNMAELTRTKRQFITYAKARAIDDVDKLATMFVQYLNTSLFQ